VSQPLPDLESSAQIIELRIPCKAEWSAVARLAVSAVASRSGFTIEEIEDVKLAVAEGITNAIQNAGSASQIDIVCESEPTQLRVRLTTSGTTRTEIKPEREEFSIDGLGIFLVRSLMDEVEYDVHAERGTNLVMVKRLQH
jgi:serine/threonine-protein kinase RsbW